MYTYMYMYIFVYVYIHISVDQDEAMTSLLRDPDRGYTLLNPEP